MNGKLRKIMTGLVIIESMVLGVSASTYGWFSHEMKVSSIIPGSAEAAYFHSGKGTEDDPYTITEPIHLYNLAWLQYLGRFNGQRNPQETGLEEGKYSIYYFKIGSDDTDITALDMTGWVLPPIGTKNNPFLGVLDGNGKTIRNLKVSNYVGENEITRRPNSVNSLGEEAYVVGFIGAIGEIGKETDTSKYSSVAKTVKNLNLQDIEVDSYTPYAIIGAAAGYVNGTLSNVAVTNSAEKKSTVKVNMPKKAYNGESAIATSVSAYNAKTDNQDFSKVTNISNYGVVGYCTPSYESKVTKSRTTGYNINTTANQFTVSEGGDATGSGGSIGMKDIHGRLSDILANYTSDGNVYTSETYTVDPEGNRSLAGSKAGQSGFGTQYSLYSYNSEFHDSNKPYDAAIGNYVFAQSSQSASTKVFYLNGYNNTITYNQQGQTISGTSPDGSSRKYYLSVSSNTASAPVSKTVSSSNGVTRNELWLFDDEGYLQNASSGKYLNWDKKGYALSLADNKESAYQFKKTETSTGSKSYTVSAEEDGITYYLDLYADNQFAMIRSDAFTIKAQDGSVTYYLASDVNGGNDYVSGITPDSLWIKETYGNGYKLKNSNGKYLKWDGEDNPDTYSLSSADENTATVFSQDNASGSFYKTVNDIKYTLAYLSGVGFVMIRPSLAAISYSDGTAVYYLTKNGNSVNADTKLSSDSYWYYENHQFRNLNGDYLNWSGSSYKLSVSSDPSEHVFNQETENNVTKITSSVSSGNSTIKYYLVFLSNNQGFGMINDQSIVIYNSIHTDGNNCYLTLSGNASASNYSTDITLNSLFTMESGNDGIKLKNYEGKYITWNQDTGLSLTESSDNARVFTYNTTDNNFSTKENGSDYYFKFTLDKGFVLEPEGSEQNPEPEKYFIYYEQNGVKYYIKAANGSESADYVTDPFKASLFNVRNDIDGYEDQFLYCLDGTDNYLSIAEAENSYFSWYIRNGYYDYAIDNYLCIENEDSGNTYRPWVLADSGNGTDNVTNGSGNGRFKLYGYDVYLTVSLTADGQEITPSYSCTKTASSASLIHVVAFTNETKAGNPSNVLPYAADNAVNDDAVSIGPNSVHPATGTNSKGNVTVDTYTGSAYFYDPSKTRTDNSTYQTYFPLNTDDGSDEYAKLQVDSSIANVNVTNNSYYGLYFSCRANNTSYYLSLYNQNGKYEISASTSKYSRAYWIQDGYDYKNYSYNSYYLNWDGRESKLTASTNLSQYKLIYDSTTSKLIGTGADGGIYALNYSGGSFQMKRTALTLTYNNLTWTNNNGQLTNGNQYLAWDGNADSSLTVSSNAGTELHLTSDFFVYGVGNDGRRYYLNSNSSKGLFMALPKYSPKSNNTGYIIGGGDGGNVRVAYYSLSGSYDFHPSGSSDSQTNKSALRNYDSANGFTNVMTVGKSGTVETIQATNGTWTSGSGENQTTYADYEKVKTKLEADLKGSQNVYGLHFMNGTISADNLVTAPYVHIQKKDYYNYQLPNNAIDFNFTQRGYIEFMAGTYGTYSSGNYGDDSFFSLHYIERNPDNTIRSIKEIKKILSDGIENHTYIYELSDGKNTTYTIGQELVGGERKDIEGSTSTGKPDSYKVIFDTSRLGKSDDVKYNRYLAYYFEIPVNEGEYALGSVSSGTGAYLMYLDIGSNAMRINQSKFDSKNERDDATFTVPDGVAYASSFNSASTEDASAFGLSGVTYTIGKTVSNTDGADIEVGVNANGVTLKGVSNYSAGNSSPYLGYVSKDISAVTSSDASSSALAEHAEENTKTVTQKITFVNYDVYGGVADTISLTKVDNGEVTVSKSSTDATRTGRNIKIYIVTEQGSGNGKTITEDEAKKLDFDTDGLNKEAFNLTYEDRNAFDKQGNVANTISESYELLSSYDSTSGYYQADGYDEKVTHSSKAVTITVKVKEFTENGVTYSYTVKVNDKEFNKSSTDNTVESAAASA